MYKKISEYSARASIFLNYGLNPNLILDVTVIMAFISMLSVSIFGSLYILMNLFLVWMTLVLIILLSFNKRYTDRSRNFELLSIFLFIEILFLIYKIYHEPLLLLLIWSFFPFDIILIFMIIYYIKNFIKLAHQPMAASSDKGMIMKIMDLIMLCLCSKRSKKIFQITIIFYVFSIILSSFLLIANYLILGAYIYFIYPLIIILLSIKIFLTMLSITKENRPDFSILIGFGIFELLFMIFISLLGAVLVIVLAFLMKDMFNLQ